MISADIYSMVKTKDAIDMIQNYDEKYVISTYNFIQTQLFKGKEVFKINNRCTSHLILDEGKNKKVFTNITYCINNGIICETNIHYIKDGYFLVTIRHRSDNQYSAQYLLCDQLDSVISFMFDFRNILQEFANGALWINIRRKIRELYDKK